MPQANWSRVLRLNVQGIARGLGDLEAEIMNAVWHQGRDVTIRNVCDGLQRPSSFNTVMTVMNNLVGKGLLTRSGSRRSYMYSAAVSREEFVTQLAQQVFRGLFEDFGEMAAVGFVEASESIDDESLAELLERLQNFRASKFP